MAGSVPVSPGKSPDGTLTPALIEFATVLAVDPERFHVTVATESHRTITEVPILTPVLHKDRGAGFNGLPEPGDQCYVLHTSDNKGEKFVILGFIMRFNGPELAETDQYSYANQRIPLLPGDISLSTADDNFMILRRGGIVQIGSTSMAQSIYMPVENLIRDYFQRYQAFSPIGEIEWGYGVTAAGIMKDDTEEDTGVLVRYNIKEAAQHREAAVEVRVGRLNDEVLDVADGQDPEHQMLNLSKKMAASQKDLGIVAAKDTAILSITISEIDTSEGSTEKNPDFGKSKGVRYIFQVDKKGNNFIRSEGFIQVETPESVFINATKGLRLEYGAAKSYAHFKDDDEFKALVMKYAYEATESYIIKCVDIQIDNVGGTVAIDSGTTSIKCDNILLGTDAGGASTSPLVRWDELKVWLETQFSCKTAWGPSLQCIAPLDVNTKTTTVKAK